MYFVRGFAAWAFFCLQAAMQNARQKNRPRVLMNTSPNIQWWHRLHSFHNAYIYYNPKDRYFPDFVSLDKDDIYWIIEGKAKRGRDEDSVQAKRKAAETLVRRLTIEYALTGQNFCYLIAY